MASTQLMNVGLTQTVYLQAVGTSTRIWLAGNGSSAYMVKSAVLTKGTASIVVKVNGHTSFQVPALGRWSDYVSTAGFTLPGNATLSTVVSGEVPIIYLGSTGGGIAWTPAVATGVEYNATTASLRAEFYTTFYLHPTSVDCTTNASASGIYGSLIIDRILADLSAFTLTYTRVGSTLAGSFTVSDVNNAAPYELQWINMRYYASAVSAGTVTVCAEVTDCRVWDSLYTSYATPEEMAARLAAMFDSLQTGCATSTGAKYYITLTEAQAVSMKSTMISGGDSSMAMLLPWFLLPLEIMQVVFDDPSVVDGDYTEPILTETTEIFSTEIITVSDNSQIAAGDTLTNNVGGFPFVYTFRNLPTGAANEIIIGATAAITAANIATALNATDGAIFTATSANEVVSVTEYTSETVTKSTTSAGVTIGAVKQSVIYTTSDPTATLPAFTSNGFCSDGTGFLPAFIGAGTCTQDDFCIGRGILPVMTCNAQSFITGLNYDSTKLEKISLLLNGNGFMQNFAPMVCVTDPDEAALLAVQFAANYITHTSDVIVWGTTESWVCPRATLYYAQGDCEDGAFLIASLLLNIGVSSAKVKVAIGYYDDTGHAWAMYQRASDDIWVNLDWTKGSTYWNAISSVDELPIAFSEA
jgi:predicted transglutaminase-like cysteine proteinase